MCQWLVFVPGQLGFRPLGFLDPKRKPSGCAANQPGLDAADARVCQSRISSAKNLWVWAVAALLGLAGIGSIILLTLPGREERRRLVGSVVRCNPEEIQSITLIPSEYASLVKTRVEVKDKAKLVALGTCLRGARSFTPNHPHTKWRVTVAMTQRNETVVFAVIHTDDEENGTFVQLSSHKTQGWNLGAFRCDPIGPILESLQQEAGRELEDRGSGSE